MPFADLMIVTGSLQNPLPHPLPTKLVGSHFPATDRQKEFRIFHAPRAGVVQVTTAWVQNWVHKDKTAKKGKGCGPNQNFLYLVGASRLAARPMERSKGRFLNLPSDDQPSLTRVWSSLSNLGFLLVEAPVGASSLRCLPDGKIGSSWMEATIGRPALADSGLVIPIEPWILAR